MSLELLRSLVWMDYRLAVLFTVVIPLILLLWSTAKNVPAITQLLIIYWRVSSLLAITVYLMMPQWPVAYVTGFMALVLIPISLWFWVDLNEEISDRQDLLGQVFSSWRWAITLYCVLAALGQTFYLHCAFVAGAVQTPSCQVWLEPPLMFKEIFHPQARAGTLGFFAAVGLVIYMLYLSYFVFVRLPKQGRSATGL
ncbi:DUF3177 family protein [uncultured Thermosynechococcus sp.]|uniref:DUF3177 family protein n=1 Tax=uncultured Thermosynechococcus sp. TaxID=436945 RepID=UPI00262D9C79|nr:DUF3177 family protein [uncultured Thermosynechococcus sp.]